MTVACAITLQFLAYLIIKVELALARIVNYDCKVCCKLKHSFMIVNYDREIFIVQATDRGPH
jgi:hypothetical protein